MHLWTLLSNDNSKLEVSACWRNIAPIMGKFVATIFNCSIAGITKQEIVMYLKKLSLAILLWFIVIPLALSAEQVTISGHPDYPPFSWVEGERVVGAGVALAQLIFNELGVEVKAENSGNWKRVLESAQHGELDAVVAIYKTPSREAFLTYPADHFAKVSAVVWVWKGHGFPYKDWSNLIGKRGTAALGESFGAGFDSFLKEKLTVEWVSEHSQNYKMLEAGHADYMPFSLYVGRIQAQHLGYEGKLEYLPTPLYSEPLYLAISQHSILIKFMPQINEIIRRFKADGTIERLIEEYLSLYAEKMQ